MMRGKRWQKITYLAALSACLLLALNTGVRSIPLLNKHGDDLVAARDYVLEHPEGPWPRDKAGKLHMAATDNLYIWLPMMAERKLSFYRHLP